MLEVVEVNNTGHWTTRYIDLKMYVDYINLLYEEIKKDSTNKYKYIVGVPRGGSVVGVWLSHMMNIPYLEFIQFVDWTENINESEFNQFLIADDIADTGKTLHEYYKMGFDIATIFYKPRCSYVPDYFGVKIPDDLWVVFPYESKEEKPNREC